MKKQGYTLAEALIALTIVGIVSAILLPISTKFAPDTDKITYLKTYDSIVKVIEQAVNNPRIYPTMVNNNNYQEFPLVNIARAQIGDVVFGDQNVGDNKLCDVLAYGLNGDNNCEQGNFTSPQGVGYSVSTTIDNNANTYFSVVEFDINGVGNGNDCSYNDVNCPNPDRFQLFVTARGDVIPRDSMGQYYIATRHSYRKNNDADLTRFTEVELTDRDLEFDTVIVQQ